MSDETIRLAERFVLAFESIAQSLAGLNEKAGRAGSKFWPEAREPREAVISRIPTEEDLIRQAQGIDGKPLKDWLEIPGEDEFIGEREKEFIEEQKRNASAESEAEGHGGDGAEETGSGAGGVSGSPPSDAPLQEG